MKRQQRITAKQEAFARAIVEGKGPSEAHNLAYRSKGSRKRVSIMAQAVLGHRLVAARITELRNMAAGPAILTRQRILEKLSVMAEDTPNKQHPLQLTADQIKGIEIVNRMQGWNEAEKIKVSGLGGLMQKIRQGAPKP